MKPRYYQVDAANAIRESLKSNRSALCVMPTGTGKTVLFTMLADSWEDRDVLILAHREELVLQPAETIEKFTGMRPAIEMGEQRVDDGSNWWGVHPNIVVASKDSLHPNRLKKFDPARFGLIVIDEAHRGAKHNRTYSRILEYFSNAKVLGVTATPDRKDKASIIGTVFDTLAYEYKLDKAIEDGYLCPIRQHIVTVHGLDFSKVRTVAGEFSDSDLEQILNQEEMLHKVVVPTLEIVGDERTIIFCATVAHAESMVQIINRYKPDSAIVVSGKTDKVDRRRLINQFRTGERQFLVNCDVVTEGFDCKEARYVVIARPLKSRGRYGQIVGRVTRPIVLPMGLTPEERRAEIANSAKPDCHVIDFKGCSNDLKLMVNVADIVADAVEIECTPEQKSEAILKAKARVTDQAEDMESLITEELEKVISRDEEKARLEAIRKKHEEKRKQIKASEAQYSTREVDGLDPNDRSTHNGQEFSSRQPATWGQKRLLIALGVSPELVVTYTKSEAGQSIGYLRKIGETEVWTRLRGVRF